MDTIERFQIKFVQRDNELAKRTKRGKMNRFGETKTKKMSRYNANNKRDWLNQKEE